MAHTYRAIRFHEYGGPDKLVTDTVSLPELKEGEVLVKVRFAGVNPIDWKLRSGAYKDFMPLSLPYTPGIDVSGVVEEVGPGVTSFAKGQAVFGVSKGGYAEYAVAAAADLQPKPERLSFEAAATLPVGSLTAWKMVEDAGVKSGQTVLVIGAAGGVGMFAVQFARLKGATVIGLASAANADFVKGLGAKPVDYKNGLAAFGIKDVDVVLDAVGGEAMEQSLAAIKKGGTIVTVAGRPPEAKAQELGIRALGSGRGPAELLRHIAELAAKGSIRTEVQRVFAFAEAADAHSLSQGGHGRGRILLKI